MTEASLRASRGACGHNSRSPTHIMCWFNVALLYKTDTGESRARVVAGRARSKPRILGFVCHLIVPFPPSVTVHGLVSYSRRDTVSKSQRFTGPFRMAQTFRAGTGDSACRSRCYRSSMRLNCLSNLLMCGPFMIRVFPTPGNSG